MTRLLLRRPIAADPWYRWRGTGDPSKDWASNLCDKSGMVFQHTPNDDTSRSWRRRAMWPLITVVMAVIGAIGGWLLATR